MKKDFVIYTGNGQSQEHHNKLFEDSNRKNRRFQ